MPPLVRWLTIAFALGLMLLPAIVHCDNEYSSQRTYLSPDIYIEVRIYIVNETGNLVCYRVIAAVSNTGYSPADIKILRPPAILIIGPEEAVARLDIPVSSEVIVYPGSTIVIGELSFCAIKGYAINISMTGSSFMLATVTLTGAIDYSAGETTYTNTGASPLVTSTTASTMESTAGTQGSESIYAPTSASLSYTTTSTATQAPNRRLWGGEAVSGIVTGVIVVFIATLIALAIRSIVLKHV